MKFVLLHYESGQNSYFEKLDVNKNGDYVTCWTDEIDDAMLFPSVAAATLYRTDEFEAKRPDWAGRTKIVPVRSTTTSNSNLHDAYDRAMRGL